MLGKHLIRSWSTNQAVIALSSGEVEYYSMVKGGSIGLGTQAMIKELGVELPITMRSDASAAIGIVMRRGLGKIRHIDVSQLWLQEKVRSGEIKMIKVKSSENKSDLLTKHHNHDAILNHMRSTSQEFSHKVA